MNLALTYALFLLIPLLLTSVAICLLAQGIAQATREATHGIWNVLWGLVALTLSSVGWFFGAVGIAAAQATLYS